MVIYITIFCVDLGTLKIPKSTHRKVTIVLRRSWYFYHSKIDAKSDVSVVSAATQICSKKKIMREYFWFTLFLFSLSNCLSSLLN